MRKLAQKTLAQFCALKLLTPAWNDEFEDQTETRLLEGLILKNKSTINGINCINDFIYYPGNEYRHERH